MNYRSFFLLILAFSSFLMLDAQDLPDAWSISDDGRMLTAGGENESGFYDPAEVHNVQLEFMESNWFSIMEENYDTGTDLLATCWIDDEQYDSVGVRFKGETSFFRNNTEKKSFNVTLDYIIDGQDVDGYNTFNLNCGWEDNTSMKEVLYNNVGHNYYMSLKSNYVALEVNGESWGPYQSVQQFDSDYIKEWYLSNNGTIWRAVRIGRGGPGSGRFGVGRSTLNYNGPDSSDYNIDYTLRRTEQEDPWAGLIDACEVLNNEPLETLEESLKEVLDIDKACWFLAHENIFADDDGYINKGGSDYFVYYEAETGRVIPMEYDGNSVLGERALAWSIFERENESDFPLIDRMLAVPSIRQRYLAHVRVILENYFNSEYIDPKIDTWKELIDPMIQADPKRFYSYSQFLSAVDDLKQSIITRRNVILNNSELQNIESLIVEDVSYTVNGEQRQRPNPDEEVNVVAQVSGQIGTAAVWLYYGEGVTGVFSKVEMFDDGMHNDGEALDGQYGASIPSLQSGAYVRYYIEAIADDQASTITYEPKGAEHDVFIYQVALKSVSESDVVINELMADNEEAIADPFGEFDDYFELYNKSSSDIDLSGWTLSDDMDELDKFTIPPGTTIAPDSYLVIWADDDEDQGELHANFKLSADGESLFLLNADRELVDEVNFPEAPADEAYSRVPNGTGPFEYQKHTQGANNDLTTTLAETDQELGIQIYPNPANSFFTVDIGTHQSSFVNLQLLSVSGHPVYSIQNQISGTFEINLNELDAGIYFLRLEIKDRIIMRKITKL